MLSLDVCVGSLVLPQLDFVDFLWEALPFMWSLWGWGKGRWVIKLTEGKRELRLIYKINKKIKQKHIVMKTPGNILG